MNRSLLYVFLFLLLNSIIALPLLGQITVVQKDPEPTKTRILFVFDASKSMYGRWQSDVKINIAQKLLAELVDSLQDVENLQMALRVYGHTKSPPPQDCNDTHLEVPFRDNNAGVIKQKLRTIVPKGTTPIARSLEKAIDDFPECDNCRNIIVLITDGIEECDGDPCAVSQALQKSGIILKPFVIGIGRNFKDAFDCVGTYFDASSEKQFRTALNVVISQALNSTTAQVNLLDSYGSPSETNVNMTFYDNFSGVAKYHFIHTLNHLGIPDTLVLDPLNKYDLVVHTIPAVKKDNIELVPGQHTIVALNAAQGSLKLKVGGINTKLVKNVSCIVRQKDDHKTLNVQYFGQTEKYLVGKYDLEILTLPRLYIEDVEVSQNHTTDIEIPSPGIANILTSTKGYGSVYYMDGEKLQWLYNLNPNIQQENLLLQPGNYMVVFRSKFANRSFYSINKKFKIKSGSTIRVKLFP